MSRPDGRAMTARERFAETMRFGRPDRVPTFEEGLRDDVLERWREQGLAPDADLSAMFDTDRREQIPVDLEPRPRPEAWPTCRGDLADLRRRLDPDDPGRLPDDWAEAATGDLWAPDPVCYLTDEEIAVAADAPDTPCAPPDRGE